MKLSNVSTAPYRPNIKRVGHKDLPIPQYMSDLDYSSIKSTKPWLENRVSPELGSTGMFGDKLKKDPKDNRDKKKFGWKVCFCIALIILLLLIVGAIIGIALGLTLPGQTTIATTASATSTGGTTAIGSTTLSTASVTTSAIICTNTGRGSLLLQTGTTPTTWTSYTLSFTASQSISMLLFGFATDGTNRFYLDDVSFVATSAPGTQLLSNPSFENSNSVPVGWTISCEMSTCGENSTRIETNSTVCLSGYCLESFCSVGRPSLAYLSQTVATTNGNAYTIAFDLKRSSIPSTGTMTFSLDII